MRLHELVSVTLHAAGHLQHDVSKQEQLVHHAGEGEAGVPGVHLLLHVSDHLAGLLRLIVVSYLE